MLATRQKIANSQGPPLPLEEALPLYPDDEVVPVYCVDGVTLIDNENYWRSRCEKGWNKVPKRFLPQLEGRAQVLPIEMRTGS